MDAPLIMHYVENNHSENDFRFLVIAKMKKIPYHQVDPGKILSQMEIFCIHILDTMAPKGLNQSIVFMGFI